MKFDYAYLENKKSELSVFQIALIYRNIPLFRAEYEPYMVCPICKEAKLTYVNDQPAYLRTAQKQSHAEDCPLAQLYLSIIQPVLQPPKTPIFSGLFNI